jgi:uncharacterized phage protein (TIGR01671 family)
MREILFRGKREYNGEWVRGSLILWNGGDAEICITSSEEHEEQSKALVYPETVGQFTGLTDKNGKKIFEGDIVQAERIGNSDNWTGYVVFWNGCFALKGLKDGNVPAIDLFKNYKVIGNIHDNPELLKNP